VNFSAPVVEDDTLQRETLADLLKDEGLAVIECTSAEAAELVVASTGQDLKTLVTDVSLSGEMSGVELAQYAKRKFPHINVCLRSLAVLHSARCFVSAKALPTERTSGNGPSLESPPKEPTCPFPFECRNWSSPS
jgi:CheY-like chemotaxis protein